MASLPVHGEHITLAQALKAAGMADTGGQAKALIRGGDVTVNGEVEAKPGRKLVPGDRFQIRHGDECTIGG